MIGHETMLSCRQITDVGILELAPLENLRFLNVEMTNVTSKGRDRLRIALPDLLVNP